MNLHILITSGGTMAPIDSVRFIDNFSTGKRGSLSAELFLLNGYNVHFLYRAGSLLPFVGRHHDLTNIDIEGYLRDKELFDNYKNRGKLILISFVTVDDYLKLLRSITQELGDKYGKGLILYLAAAVSDFQPVTVPLGKIQSSKSSLSLELKGVSKNLLHVLFHEIASKAFSITFKLETDAHLLKSKALEALKNYNHDLVIGNLLETRDSNVVLYLKNGDEIVFNSPNLEKKLVEMIISLHNQHVHDK